MAVMHELRDGSTTSDPRLDRLPQWDERNLRFPAGALLAPDEDLRSRSWRLYALLDQQQEGRCVEFGWCHELNAQPFAVSARRVRQITDQRLIYCAAQRIDEWEGGASYCGHPPPHYEGTSVLAGAKIVQSFGYLDEYRWAADGHEVARVVANHGPVVIGVNWHEGMSRPGLDGVIEPTGAVQGGHAVAVTRLERRRGEWWIGGPNSWGRDWGDRGFWRMRLTAFEELFAARGDGCVPVVRRR